MISLGIAPLLASILVSEAAPVAGSAGVLGVDEVSERTAELHDSDTVVRGRVVWAGCRDEICLLEMAGEGGSGQTILVRTHTALPRPPEEITGRTVTVTGRYYAKIYPRTRMAAWQGLGWRADESLPEMASIRRLEAAQLVLETEARADGPSPAPLLPWAGPTFDLETTEFEAVGGMGTGRKCLAPGEMTPVHSTGGVQELLLGHQGVVTVELPGGRTVELEAGEGLYLPPGTDHGLRNVTLEAACYLFVYGAVSGGGHE